MNALEDEVSATAEAGSNDNATKVGLVLGGFGGGLVVAVVGFLVMKRRNTRSHFASNNEVKV